MNDNSEISKKFVDNFITYRIVKWSLVNPIFKIYFQGRIYGADKVPLNQPLIVVSNHASLFDPPLLTSAINRPVAFMAKEELFEVNGLKQVITALGAYAVNRESGDRRAIKNAINCIQKGWSAGIFIEGTRTADGKIHNPKLGAALIAAKTQASLLPLCLWGTEKITQNSTFPKPVPITIRLGDLIPPPVSIKKEVLETVTNQCAQAINALHDLGR